MVLVNLVQPGKLIEESQRKENRINYEKWVSATDGVEILDGQQYNEDSSNNTDQEKTSEFVKAKMADAKKTKDCRTIAVPG